MGTAQNFDEFFMFEAIKEAWKAFDKGEVPVGAVCVVNNQIISRAHNLVESLQDPSAHAELLAVRYAAQLLRNWRLTNCTLYTTLEPCSMCSGVFFLSRLYRVVFGAYDLRHGANGSWIDLYSKKHPTHTVLIQGLVLPHYCRLPLLTFFKNRRLEKKK